MIGEVTPQARKLVEVTQQSFFEGIKFAKAGNHLNDISKAIQAYAESFGFGVVRDLVGTESAQRCMRSLRYQTLPSAAKASGWLPE